MRTDTLIISLVLAVSIVAMLFGALWVQAGVESGAASAQMATVRQPCLNGAYLPIDADPVPFCPPWRVPADAI